MPPAPKKAFPLRIEPALWGAREPSPRPTRSATPDRVLLRRIWAGAESRVAPPEKRKRAVRRRRVEMAHALEVTGFPACQEGRPGSRLPTDWQGGGTACALVMTGGP